ncbi:MAG: AsmA family protein, partial [Bacteroidales bacterium]|nr:AsmA family protein [Bacteroidales bacterium]
MKKTLKTVLLGLLCLVVLGGVVSYLCRDRIAAQAKALLAEYVHADVKIGGVRLHLLRTFPDAGISLCDVTVTGYAPFTQDTLLAFRDLTLQVDLKSLLHPEQMTVKSIRLDRPRIMLHATADGQSNWDIFSAGNEAASEDDDATPSRFGLNIDRLTMRDGRIGYTDDSLRLHVALQPAQLDLKGRLSAARSQLNLQADLGEVTLWYDGNCLVNHVQTAWDASIDAHLDSMHFILEDNEMRINDLIIALAGTATLQEGGLLTDLTFDAPSAQLKSLLSLIPAVYMQDYASLRTDGILHASGSVRGVADSVRIPDISLKLQVADGTVHYETLPEKIQNIQLDLDAFCDGADMDRSTVTLHRAGFSMAGNPFNVSGAVSTPVSNLNLQAEARGTVQLGTLDRYIPIEAGTVRGTLRADTRLQLYMNDLDEGRYERIQCSGTMNLAGFSLAADSLPPLAVQQADLQFSPQTVSLQTAGIRLGNSRIGRLDGSLSQFIPYLLSDAVLQGTLQMEASCIDLNEWMTDDAQTEEAGDSVVLETPFIPANVDLRISASADTVLYENLVLKQTKGEVRVADQCVILQPVTTKLLGGDFTLNGTYNTQDTLAPAFDL